MKDKKPYIVGNWKMNQTLEQVEAFFTRAHVLIEGDGPHCHTWIAPQALHLSKAIEWAKPRALFQIGGQNIHSSDGGAFTGENSPRALKELGASFCLIGHSERRTLFREGDDFLRDKVLKALECGLKAVFCVGENEEERQARATGKVVGGQLRACLAQLPPSASGHILIAYEPVWAIGTGRSATPEQAEEVHHTIFQLLPELGLDAGQTPILYGGSVNPSNIAQLLSCRHVDGALVGGASLDASTFVQLAKTRRPC